jgi:hypothetical protein
LDGAAISAQRAADPATAASEWDGTFRDDVASYLDDALIDNAVEHGRPLELPPLVGGYTVYAAFVDAAGGTGGDAYALAGGHRGGGRIVIDLVRDTAGRYDPEGVTKAYASLLQEYGISTVTGDSYAAQWVAGSWSKCGVHYTRSELPKSQIYLEAIPLFARGLVRLPDHPRLLRELRLLERQTHRGGRDTVDHPRGGHDDLANCVAGVLRALSDHLGYVYDLSVDRDAVDLVLQPPKRLFPTLTDEQYLRIRQPIGPYGIPR